MADNGGQKRKYFKTATEIVKSNTYSFRACVVREMYEPAEHKAHPRVSPAGTPPLRQPRSFGDSRISLKNNETAESCYRECSIVEALYRHSQVLSFRFVIDNNTGRRSLMFNERAFRIALLDRGLSQNRLAIKIGVHPVTLSNAIRRGRKFDPELKQEIAKELGVKESELFTDQQQEAVVNG